MRDEPSAGTEENARRRTGLRPSFLPYMSSLIGTLSWKALPALGLMVGIGLTEGIGVLMLVPLLDLVEIDVEQGALGGIFRVLSSAFSAVGVPRTLPVVLAVYVVIISTHGLLFRWNTTFSLALQHGYVVALRQRLYRAISNSSWQFFSRSRFSDFAHVLTSEVERAGAATYNLLHLSATAIVALAYILLALKLSVVMTVLVFACGIGLMLLLRRKTDAAREAGEALSTAMTSLYAAITEHLGGMKTAKSYGVEDRHVRIFSELTETVGHTYVCAIRNQAEVKYWFDVGSVLILSIVLYMSIEVFAISTAEVLLLLFLFARIMPRFSAVQQDLQSFANFLPAFTSVMNMQARCEAAAETVPARTEPIALRDAVQLEQTTFAYEKAPVIRNLNLTIRAGQTTAIVGPSGAGKSTIADLVIGLLSPDEGGVLVDGVALEPERLQAWRDQIGYVAQDTFLFHDTVRANLLWAKPDACDEEMGEALRLAAAREFVQTLPEKTETILGDRGVRLSGGERQRLALARALLRRPALLILDEATSNLDSENENRILNAIDKLHGQVTILLITHRLTTVRGADIIHVLEDGRLVESGPWGELIANETGRFYALWKAQSTERQSAPSGGDADAPPE